jgi:hypothetical protein
MQVHVSDYVLVILPNPSQSSNTPLYPQNVASQGACPQLLAFMLFSFQTHI